MLLGMGRKARWARDLGTGDLFIVGAAVDLERVWNHAMLAESDCCKLASKPGRELRVVEVDVSERMVALL